MAPNYLEQLLAVLSAPIIYLSFLAPPTAIIWLLIKGEYLSVLAGLAMIFLLPKIYWLFLIPGMLLSKALEWPKVINKRYLVLAVGAVTCLYFHLLIPKNARSLNYRN